MTGTPEYNTYNAMLGRCLNENNHKFEHYGGRGIKICDRWKESFANFYEDMGARPAEHTLDRIDVNGDYEPANCRWATATQQAQNKTTSINLTHQGETKWASTTETRIMNPAKARTARSMFISETPSIPPGIRPGILYILRVSNISNT